MIYYIIFIITLIVSNILLGALYFNKSSKFKILEQNLEDLSIIIDSLKSTNRKGTYKENITIVKDDNDKNGNLYECIIHVEELDQYTNGDSEIKLIKVELIRGYSPHNYEYVKKGMRDRFCSIKKTSDIEWRESVQKIKDIRREKLKTIDKLLTKN